MNNISSVEDARTHIEKVMLQLDPRQSKESHQMYLKGTIDTMADLGVISEEDRETLYLEYTEIG